MEPGIAEISAGYANNVKYCQEHKEENARRQREYRARLKVLKEDKK